MTNILEINLRFGEIDKGSPGHEGPQGNDGIPGLVGNRGEMVN